MIIKFEEINKLNETIKRNGKNQIEALEALKVSVNSFISEDKVSSDEGINTMKAYYDTIYIPVIGTLKNAINNHVKSSIKYTTTYDNNDLGGDTYLDTEQLEELKKNLRSSSSDFESIDKSGKNLRVNLENEDLGVVVSKPSSKLSVNQREDMLNMIDEALKTIDENEKGFKGKDSFSYTSGTMAAIKQISSLLTIRRESSVSELMKSDYWNSEEGKALRRTMLGLWYQAYTLQNLKGEDYDYLPNKDDDLYKDFKLFEYLSKGSKDDLSDPDTFQYYLDAITKTAETQNIEDLPADIRYYFAWGDDYGNIDERYGNGYVRNFDGDGGNCVWFCKARSAQVWGPYEQPGSSGWDWYKEMKKDKHFRTGYKERPPVGAVLSWSYGERNTGDNLDRAGHVAFVEGYTKDGDLIVSQSGYSRGKINVVVLKQEKDGTYKMRYSSKDGIDYNAPVRDATYNGWGIAKDVEVKRQYTRADFEKAKQNAPSSIGTLTPEDIAFLKSLSN